MYSIHSILIMIVYNHFTPTLCSKPTNGYPIGKLLGNIWVPKYMGMKIEIIHNHCRYGTKNVFRVVGI